MLLQQASYQKLLNTLLPDKFRLVFDKLWLVLDNFSLMPVKKKSLLVKIEVLLDNARTFSTTP